MRLLDLHEPPTVDLGDTVHYLGNDGDVAAIVTIIGDDQSTLGLALLVAGAHAIQPEMNVLYSHPSKKIVGTWHWPWESSAVDSAVAEIIDGGDDDGAADAVKPSAAVATVSTPLEQA